MQRNSLERLDETSNSTFDTVTIKILFKQKTQGKKKNYCCRHRNDVNNVRPPNEFVYLFMLVRMSHLSSKVFGFGLMC